MPASFLPLLGESRTGLWAFDQKHVERVSSPSTTKGWKVFDLASGRLLQHGPLSQYFTTEPSDNKKMLGLAELKRAVQKGKQLSDDDLRFQVLSSCSPLILTAMSKTGGSGGGQSLQDVEKAIDSLENEELRRGMWGTFAISQQTVSLVVLENTSRVPARGVRLSFRDADRYRIEPLFAVTATEAKFDYDREANLLNVAGLSPSDQIVVVAKSFSPVAKTDLGLAWDKYSEIDMRKLLFWLVTPFVLCVMAFLVDYLWRSS